MRDELTAALAEGRGVTAKVRWISSRGDEEGRARWIHCTPLLGQNGSVGVWMVVIVDDEVGGLQRRFRIAPPVDQVINGKSTVKMPHGPYRDGQGMGSETNLPRPSTSYSIGTGGAGASLESFAI